MFRAVSLARLLKSVNAPLIRCYSGPAGPVREQIASSGYPDMSMSRILLDRCLEEAVGRGVDVSSAYEPWLPVDLFQTLLVDIHEHTGCTWLSAIVCTCVAIRTLLLPVSVASIRGSREKAVLQPQYENLMQKQKELRIDGDPEKNSKIQKQIQQFTQKHGRLFMMKGTWNLIFVQLPLYITAFAALRGMAGHPDLFRGFAMESPLWLESLALADPCYVMPILTSAIMLTNQELFGSVDTEAAAPTEVADGSGQVGQSTMQKYQKIIARISALLFIPFTQSFPAGVFIFMCTNMVTAAAQNQVLRQPAVERWLEIPPRAKKKEIGDGDHSSETDSRRTLALLNLNLRNGSRRLATPSARSAAAKRDGKDDADDGGRQMLPTSENSSASLTSSSPSSRYTVKRKL
ncbi:unnamed protein product [Durusdinium trenchii]|uniref:Membrane insertase YidC/Oxa/ALB C-terminal domain-containing protein n=1 Tax=Durusdinium trenchii TaxID=1381693 RepID=A0ABP0KL56_9DINO